VKKFLVVWLIGGTAVMFLVLEVSLWWLFLLVPLSVYVGFWGRYLLYSREYREIDGKLHVKEGRGNWEEFEGHLRRDHPKEYQEYIQTVGKE